MKKLMISSLFSTVSLLFLISCTGTPQSNGEHLTTGDAKSASYTRITTEMRAEKIHTLIVSAGEKKGWKMTEFKSNAVIAEKFTDADAKVLTVYFDKDFFHLEPADSELQASIEKTLSGSSEE